MKTCDCQETMSLVLSSEFSSESNEKEYTCVVKDVTKAPQNRFILKSPSSTTLAKLYSDVCTKVGYVSGTFDLIFLKRYATDNSPSEANVDETDATNTLEQLNFEEDSKNHLQIRERIGQAIEYVRPGKTLEQTDSNIPSPPLSTEACLSQNGRRRNAVSNSSPACLSQEAIRSKGEQILNRPNSPVESEPLIAVNNPRYVGLVNQAMTCYLNSLIQTLFMTPEFRNALYKWEWDSKDVSTTSIPYQLQHLFLLLQTTNKQAVETTGLTGSFGWDSTEAWQQHDIQELCRVMFDALEKKFQGTDQADLIKRLYEGKMKDYVQCCECGHESARNDTFLDVPITIRPFGSTTTYRSVREGLHAFVEPEILDQNNQYFCEKCAKKCDAKKGLKFTQFPYLLTLQLKRFDFDYSTMHRIKLNDRMWFPLILNLNSFIEREKDSDARNDDPEFTGDNEEATAKRSSPIDEDSCSHDSGHDPDQNTMSSGSDSNHADAHNSSEEEASSVDEGIDIESQKSSKKKRSNSTCWWLSDQQQIDDYLKDGPYVYELFSIMVHSGSAAGGHYYAYVKSFENGRWYSFNDQIVSPITHVDIEKTFGGSPYARSSTYYSSFSSSTNAYMLMYRQVDSEKNASFIPACDLPEHIKRMIEQEERDEELRKIRLEQEKNTCSIRLFCRHPSLFKCQIESIVEENFSFHKDISLAQAVVQAHASLKLDPKVVPMDRCRLVKYDHINDVLDRSFDLDTDDAHSTLSQLLGGVRTAYLFDLLLETRAIGEKFQIYESGGVTVKIYVADHDNMRFYDPVVLRAAERQTVLQLKSAIAQRIRCSPLKLLVAYEKYSGECHLMQSVNRTLKSEGFFRSAKVFVDVMSDEEYQLSETHPVNLDDTRLWGIIDRLANVITINVALPPELAAEAEKHQQTQTTTNQDPDPTTKLTTDGATISASSSDEGVGSLGGSASPEQAPGDAAAEDSTSNEVIADFWQTPELVPDDDQPDDACCGRRRNNSYDNGAGFSPISIDFQGKLQERLEGVVSAASPTSSLKCEDGDSSHSGPGSISDVDFDGEDVQTDQVPHAGHFTYDDQDNPASQPSEGSSLSTSCSTLDSTDTLCNTTERAAGIGDGNLTATYSSATAAATDNQAYVFQAPVDGAIEAGNDDEQPKPMAAKLLPGVIYFPGRAVACNTSATSDYGKALMYADAHQGGGSNPAVQPVSDPAGNLAESWSQPAWPGAKGTGDPTDDDLYSKKAPGCSGTGKGEIVTSEPGKSVAWLDEVGKDDALASSCSPVDPPADVCTSCGIYPPNVSTSSPDENKDPESISFPGSDPDSGEALDKLKPLVSNVKDASTSSTDTPSIRNKGHSAFEPVPASGRAARERSVSTSSIGSDGWGVSGEIANKNYHFRWVSSTQSTMPKNPDDDETVPCKVLSIVIDKRMPLLAFKRHLAFIIHTPTRRFCVYKQYSSRQEVEMSAPSDDFKLISDGANFVVRLGRALRKDEFRCKLYQLELDEEETAKHLVNWIVQRNMSIEVARKQLSMDLAEQCHIQADPSRIRIRKKAWRSPGQVYLPEDQFGTDISLYGALEFFVEFLHGDERKTKRSQLLLLCRRWRPSQLRFDDFEEVLLSESESTPSKYLGFSADNVREELAELTGIAVENIQVAKGRGIFPYRVSVLDADRDLDWLPADKKYTHPIYLTDDGTVVFYKDKTEQLKECTEEERAQILNEENKSESTINNSSNSSSRKASGGFSPSSPGRPLAYRREKALRIYTVDSSPTPKNAEVTTEL